MTISNKLRSDSLTVLRPSLAALALATFAFGCAERSEDQSKEGVLPTVPAAAAPATPVLPATSATTLTAVPTSPSIATTPATPSAAARRESAPVGSRVSSGASLVVKRFVVAADVRDREPLAVSEVPMDAPRVFAFAELQNRGSEAEQVRITFERKGTKESVGHATLSIPASVPRHRTWATSRHVHTPGTWEAVLWTESGVEIGRTAFEVTETKSPATT